MIEREVCGSQADEGETNRNGSPEGKFFEMQSSPLVSGSEDELDSRVIFSPLQQINKSINLENTASFQPNLSEEELQNMHEESQNSMQVFGSTGEPTKQTDHNSVVMYNMSPTNNVNSPPGLQRVTEAEYNQHSPVLELSQTGLFQEHVMNSPRHQIQDSFHSIDSNRPPFMNNMSSHQDLINGRLQTGAIQSPPQRLTDYSYPSPASQERDVPVYASPQNTYEGQRSQRSYEGHRSLEGQGTESHNVSISPQRPDAGNNVSQQNLPSPSAWKIPDNNQRQPTRAPVAKKQPFIVAGPSENSRGRVVPVKNSDRGIAVPIPKSRHDIQSKRENEPAEGKVKVQGSYLKQGQGQQRLPVQGRNYSDTRKKTMGGSGNKDVSVQGNYSNYERQVEGSYQNTEGQGQRTRNVGQQNVGQSRSSRQDKSSPHAPHPGANVVTQIQQEYYGHRTDPRGHHGEQVSIEYCKVLYFCGVKYSRLSYMDLFTES